MNIAKCMLVGGAVMLTAATFAAELEHVSSGEVRVGEWNTNFAVAKQYAEANQLPLLAFFSNPGCAKCNKMKEACNTAEFLAWQQSVNMVFAFGEGDPQVKNFTRNSSGQYPYLRLYWPAGGVDISFSGRSGSIPASGSTLQAQLMSAIGKYVSGEIPVGPITPSPVIGSEWNRARKLTAAAYTASGALAGRLEITAGKVSKTGRHKGSAKVSAKLMGMDGKSKSFKAVYANVDSKTVVSLTGAAGSCSLALQGDAVSGTIESAIYGACSVQSAVIGGTLAGDTYLFSLTDYPTVCEGYPVIRPMDYLPLMQVFTCTGTRWTFPRKGSIRYDAAQDDFVFSTMLNPSGLKLSYKVATGLFKGSFTVYAEKSETKTKKYKATVTGFVVDGRGMGVAEIKKVGKYACVLGPAK